MAHDSDAQADDQVLRPQLANIDAEEGLGEAGRVDTHPNGAVEVSEPDSRSSFPALVYWLVVRHCLYSTPDSLLSAKALTFGGEGVGWATFTPSINQRLTP